MTFKRSMINRQGVVVGSCTQIAKSLTAAIDGEMEWYNRRWHEVAIIEVEIQK